MRRILLSREPVDPKADALSDLAAFLPGPNIVAARIGGMTSDTDRPVTAQSASARGYEDEDEDEEDYEWRSQWLAMPQWWAVPFKTAKPPRFAPASPPMPPPSFGPEWPMPVSS